MAGNLAYENEERTTYLVSGGAVDLILAALHRHAAHRGVQFRGCIALYFIAKYGGPHTRLLLRESKAAAAQVHPTPASRHLKCHSLEVPLSCSAALL